ncbi:MAG: NAD-binding protein, partial [Myxococcota bacterium]
DHRIGAGSKRFLHRCFAIGRGRGIAAATGSDATNIFVTLSARQMNPRIHIITRVDDEASVQKAFRAGANAVINPYGISGARMAQGLIHPHAAQLLDRAVGRGHNEFEIEDVPIGEVELYNGRLGELDIPERHGVLIVAVRRPDGQLVTSLDRHTELRPGDIAIVVGRPTAVRQFSKAATAVSHAT